MQLNPFECETLLREDFQKKRQDSLDKRNMESKAIINANRASIGQEEDFSMINYEDSDESNELMPSMRLKNHQSRFNR